MNWLEALILGIIQGLTEFLPVSSSGHLELGKAIFGLQGEENMTFTVVVHGATMLSVIIVFRHYILQLIKGLFRFSWNQETRYILMIIVSMIPAVFAGLFFEEKLETLFDGNVIFVGVTLLITATILWSTRFAGNHKGKITWRNAFIVGLAQAVAILPGISRSGATISTGLLLGIKRDEVAKFSFLMVVPVILGANALKIYDLSSAPASEASLALTPLITGFLAAFVSGLVACQWMLNIIKKGKLSWFALYCLIIGSIAIAAGILR